MTRFDPRSHGLRFAPEYGRNHLSDHLPMAAHALLRLGATDGQVRSFAEDHLGVLTPIDVGGRGDVPRTAGDLGSRERYPSFVRGFVDAIEGEGRAEVLRATLPLLVPGVGTAAFHGLIRTAYGIDANNDHEVAAGLAYWADAYSVPKIGTRKADCHDGSATEQLRYATKRLSEMGSFEPDGATIFEQMASLASEPDVAEVLAACSGRAHELADIAEAALRIYFATEGDFTALHCVTGTHAARLIMPYVPDDAELRRSLWTGVLLAYFTVGAFDPDRLDAEPAPQALSDWSSMRKSACASGDAHDVKFAYTCWEESKAYPHLPYREAAQFLLS